MEQFIIEKLVDNSQRITSIREMITDLINLEDTLHEFDELYKSFFSLSDEVLLIFNSQLVVKHVSPNVERLTGYQPDEMIGKTFQQLNFVDQAEQNDAVDIAEYVLSHGNIYTSYLMIITKTGEKRISEINGLPIIRNNQAVGVIVVCKKTNKEN